MVSHAEMVFHKRREPLDIGSPSPLLPALEFGQCWFIGYSVYLNKCGFQCLQIQCEVFQITVTDSRVSFGFEISSKLTCFSCGLHLFVCFGGVHFYHFYLAEWYLFGGCPYWQCQGTGDKCVSFKSSTAYQAQVVSLPNLHPSTKSNILYEALE